VTGERERACVLYEKTPPGLKKTIQRDHSQKGEPRDDEQAQLEAHNRKVKEAESQCPAALPAINSETNEKGKKVGAGGGGWGGGGGGAGGWWGGLLGGEIAGGGDHRGGF